MLSKKDFPIFKGNPKLIYLDSAATSQIPGEVLDVHNEWYLKSKANVHRSVYDLSNQSTKLYELSRQQIASHFGVKTLEVVFVKSATEGLNLLAAGLQNIVKPGQSIVISQLEHHSNYLPWLRLAKQTGATLRIIPHLNGYIDLNQAKKLIDKTTTIVSITHGSNVLGTIQPIKEISKLGHKYQAKIIVDGSQVVPHQAVKPWELGADAYVFSGHKVYGLHGSGVVMIKKDFAQTLEPLLVGGDMVESVTLDKYALRDIPWKFEAGTPNPAVFIGLVTALTLISDWAQQEEFESNLLKQLRKTLKEHGMIIHNPDSSQLPLINFTFPGLHPHDVGSLLNEQDIAVRTGFMCAQPLTRTLNKQGVIRASLGLWNTSQDIVKLGQAIKNIQKKLKL